MRVAAGGGAEREQARPVAAVAADRQFGAHDHAEAVAQRVQPLDPRHVVHEAEGVAVGIQLAAVEARPCRHAGAGQPALEPRVAPLALRRVDRIVAAIAGIELSQQPTDDGGLVLLHQVPQWHVDRHAARLDQRDRLGGIVRPVQYALDVGGRQSGAAAQLRAQQAAPTSRTSSSQ